MTSRLIIGNIGGGGFGLKCTVPGVDVLTADNNNPALFSFNSSWSNMIRIAASGYANITYTSNTTYSSSSPIVHSLGFTPFIEVRSMENYANRIFDEFAISNYQNGPNGGFFVNKFQRLTTVGNSSSVTIRVWPWTRLAFAGEDPYLMQLSPGTVKVLWYIYREPAAI